MPNSTTYDTDFYLWTQQQAALLRQGLSAELDTAHLIDEIEDMGANSRRALESYLRNIMLHLLKWRYQPERRGTSWKLSIRDGRHQLAKRVKDSPSLQPKIPDMITGEYPLAREYAAAETDLPLPTFPEVCSFTVEQIMDPEYWPD